MKKNNLKKEIAKFCVSICIGVVYLGLMRKIHNIDTYSLCVGCCLIFIYQIIDMFWKE